MSAVKFSFSKGLSQLVLEQVLCFGFPNMTNINSKPTLISLKLSIVLCIPMSRNAMRTSLLSAVYLCDKVIEIQVYNVHVLLTAVAALSLTLE